MIYMMMVVQGAMLWMTLVTRPMHAITSNLLVALTELSLYVTNCLLLVYITPDVTPQ